MSHNLEQIRDTVLEQLNSEIGSPANEMNRIVKKLNELISDKFPNEIKKHAIVTIEKKYSITFENNDWFILLTIHCYTFENEKQKKHEFKNICINIENDILDSQRQLVYRILLEVQVRIYKRIKVSIY